MDGCMDVCGLPADAAVQCPDKKKRHEVLSLLP